MARVYKRDSRGRFASGGGGGGGGRPAAKRVSRERNRLTRDNAGKITGQGGSGATARGGRLKTASGNQRATQLDRLKGRIAGTISKSGKGKPRMKAAGLNKDGMAVFKSTDKPAKSYKIPQRQAPAAKPARRKKTEQEILFQANRIIGKNYRRSAQAMNKGLGLDESLRQARRNNFRANVLVPRALNRRGLLGKYMELTKPADPTYMTRAGEGIKPPRPRRR